MTTTIQIKRRILGGSAGPPASLNTGELAYNEVDGGLYIGLSNGTIAQINSAGSGATTGDAKLTFKAAPDTGWVFMNDGTIGDASSGGTTRANSDTLALWTLLYNNIQYTAAQTCTISIANPAVITATAHPFSVNQRVIFSTTGALPAPITAGTSYFIISTGLTANAFRISTTLGGTAISTVGGTQSGTHTVTGNFELQVQNSSGTTVGRSGNATTDYNAHYRLPLPLQLGRAIVTAGAGAGLTSRSLGFNVGEESHAQSSAELSVHTHGVTTNNAMTWSGQIFSDSVDSYIVPTNPGASSIALANTGSGTAANVMQPSTFWNIMIKL